MLRKYKWDGSLSFRAARTDLVVQLDYLRVSEGQSPSFVIVRIKGVTQLYSTC